MRTLIFAICLTLAGCATQTRWHSYTRTQADFVKDEYECRRDAMMVPPRQQVYGGLAGAFEAAAYRQSTQDLYRRCMEAKGWKSQ